MALIRRLYGEYALILMVLVIGVGISGWFAWLYHANSQTKKLDVFRAAAQDRIELIRDRIEHNRIILQSVAAFFRASEHVNRQEFAIYTGQILKDYSYIHSLEWIPHVPAVERTEYEKTADFPNFHFWEENKDNRKVSAQARSEYFPIYYSEPQSNGNARLIGFDIASDPERYKTLIRAREERAMTASGRISLLQSSTPGVTFFEPVYLNVATRNEQGVSAEYERMAGFVRSVVPLGDMLDAALEPLSYSGTNIAIHDLSAEAGEPKVLYVRSTRVRSIPDEEILEDYRNPDLLTERSVIDVGRRKWEIAVLPARGAFASGIGQESYFIFAGGVLGTLILVGYMFNRVRENERIAWEVAERTEELSEAKYKMEMILLSTHEGIAGLDRDGNISFSNGTGSRLLGYRKQELIGRHHHALFHSKHADGTTYDIDDCPIQRTLEHAQSSNVQNDVFWHKNGTAVPVEYTSSPIMEGGEITGAVLVFRDITERRALERKLEQMARYDQLTGIANRVLFIDLLKNALSRADRTGKKVGLIYLDLNGFKQVNDTLGHAAGDTLLKAFADRVQMLVRDSDTFARMGGDEFTILADNLANHEECMKVIDRLRTALDEPFEIDGHKFNVGASIGVAYYPDHAGDYETLISCSDTAMYRAKKADQLYSIFKAA